MSMPGQSSVKSPVAGPAPLPVHNRKALPLARRLYNQLNPNLLKSVEQLRYEAGEAMKKGPFSIADKDQLPPSGDKRDYLSMGPYWWPDPDRPDGLPYIRRDGETNPESNRFDRPRLAAMTETVETLALAWFFFVEPAFAERAGELLRGFFLDPERGMNPNLEFGQAIPGRCPGRGIGIIETLTLADRLIDSICLLQSSPGLSNDDYDGLRSWFGRYLDWLLNSDNGNAERQQKNNHGTAFDLQVVVFALFCGRGTVAFRVLESVPERRLIPQIEPDGRQPHELARTRALSYSTMNLKLFLSLAEIAAELGLDLSRFSDPEGRSIRRALEWLIPYWTGDRSWTYQQITPFAYDKAYDILRQAARIYQEPAYETALTALPLPEETRSGLRTNLYYP